MVFVMVFARATPDAEEASSKQSWELGAGGVGGCCEQLPVQAHC
jgi:hypothetical protein